jgi:hypothetical protein
MTEPARTFTGTSGPCFTVEFAAEHCAGCGQLMGYFPPSPGVTYRFHGTRSCFERFIAKAFPRKKKVISGKGPRRRATASANVKQKRRGKSNA